MRFIVMVILIHEGLHDVHWVRYELNWGVHEPTLVRDRSRATVLENFADAVATYNQAKRFWALENWEIVVYAPK